MDFVSELQLGNRLGGGFFGEVFEGIAPVHGKVAIKRLQKMPHESQAEWAGRNGEILAEGIHLKTASHRNIVQFINAGICAKTGVLHLVLEFCNEGSLHETYCNHPLKLVNVRKIATEVSAGLAHIHSKGLVHRDIKPANILIHSGVIKIADFGLVSDRIVLGYASLAGYLEHVAPEVHVTGQTSFKSDIWALGMTLFRLLHGDQYYENWKLNLTVSIEDLVENGGFAKKLPWLPHIPKQWRRFITMMMSDDPRKRHESAHKVGMAVSRLSINPDWQVATRSDEITWTRKKSDRENYVKLWWTNKSYFWEATRIGGGKRDQSMGGSKGYTLSKKEAWKQLTAFFEDQR